MPKVEDLIGKPLSPYAVTKYLNELYAEVFSRTYGLQTIGLRYFNVFGTRQDPNGPYAAVMPNWAKAIRTNQPCMINGDGETTRDFCYVDNVVQANILAGTTSNPEAINQVYNVAYGEQTSLNTLHKLLTQEISALDASVIQKSPIYRDFRKGDVRHSLADIGKARRLLGYHPEFSVRDGLHIAMKWYVGQGANLAEMAKL